MKNMLIVLVVAFALLISGCAQSPPANAPPQNANPAPAAPQALPHAPQVAPAEPPPANASAGAAPPPSDTCTVEFQKDASNIYYVMVKTSSAKEVSVTCPNGKDGQKQGALYFCSQIDVPSPAIAYLDGKECARSQFSMPAPAASGGQQCKVILAPSRITAGQTSGISITGYVSQDKSTVAYNCGNREITESASTGMFDTGKICKFETPGTIYIYAKINGVECGSALLSVFSASQDCSVYGSAFAMDKGQYVYTAKVAARGYSGTDELRYSCYGTPFGIRANTIQNTTDFVTTIECRSATGPLSKNVAVTMGGDACGEMNVAQ